MAGDHETAEQAECRQLVDRIEPFAISVPQGLREAVAALPDTQSLLRQIAIALHHRDGYQARLFEEVDVCHGQPRDNISTIHQTGVFVHDKLMEFALTKIVMALAPGVPPRVRDSGAMFMAIPPARSVVA